MKYIYSAIFLCMSSGIGIELAYWIDRATQAEHYAKRTRGLELQAAYLEGVFVACLNNDLFYVQNAVYTCESRRREFSKTQLKGIL